MTKTDITKKWLCRALTIILLITGMCFACLQADSISECQKTELSPSQNLISASFSRSACDSADEVSGLRALHSLLNQVKDAQDTGEEELGLILLLLAVLLVRFQYSLEMRRLCACVISRNVIIRYIQNQDGFKELF